MKPSRFIPLLFSLAGIGLDRLGLWCVYAVPACPYRPLFNSIFEEILTPSYLFAIAFIIPSVFLLFVPETAWHAWLRFARWWLPLSILLIILTPDFNGNILILIDYSKLATAKYMGMLFAILSMIILGWHTFRTKKK